MAINKKLIHFDSKAAFTSTANNAQGIKTANLVTTPDSNGNVGNIPYRSIVFIKDSGEIWTHGKYYSNSLPHNPSYLTNANTLNSEEWPSAKFISYISNSSSPYGNYPTSAGSALRMIRSTGSDNYTLSVWELYASLTENELWFRNSIDGAWAQWYKIIHQGNLSLLNDNFLPLSGGTLAGALTVKSSISLITKSDNSLTEPNQDLSITSFGMKSDSDTIKSWKFYSYQGTDDSPAGIGYMPIVFGSPYPTGGGLFFTGSKSYSGTTYDNYWGINTNNPLYTLDVNGDIGANKFVSHHSNTEWVGGMKNSSLYVNGTSGYYAWVSGRTHDGYIAIGAYPGSSNNNQLYFTYIVESNVNNNTNEITNQMRWDGASNTLYATTFSGNVNYSNLNGGGTIANKALITKSDGTFLLSNALGSNAFSSTAYLPLTGGTLTGNIILENSKYIYGKDTNGNQYLLAGLNQNNVFLLGWLAQNRPDYSTAIYGSNIILYTTEHSGESYTNPHTFKISNNGTFTYDNHNIYHAGNLTIKTLMGSTAIGDSDEPVYWNGNAFVKANAYPTKASWNYDDVYLKDVLLDTGNSTDKNKSASLTNGNVYLKLFKTINSAEAEDSKVKIYGSTNVSVTTDSNGDIKITGVDSVSTATNADTVDAHHAMSSGSLLYKYHVTTTIPAASVTSDFWYATITFSRSYAPELTKSLLTASYSNRKGHVYLNTYTYYGTWYAFSTDYNGNNIKGIAHNAQNNPIYYVKLAKPTILSGSLPDGNIHVYSTYNCTITVSAEAPSGVTFTDIVAGAWTNLAANTAATATKLATARTINGTSFDGTSNITTANWGTERTITIGSTGKSVNGSENVSWTLAEIGALPLSAGSSNKLTGDLYLSSSSTSPSLIFERTDSGLYDYKMFANNSGHLEILCNKGGSTWTNYLTLLSDGSFKVGSGLITATKIANWDSVYTWLTTTTADTDTTINKWKELEAFLNSITESDTLAGLLALYLPLSGGTITGNLLVNKYLQFQTYPGANYTESGHENDTTNIYYSLKNNWIRFETADLNVAGNKVAHAGNISQSATPVSITWNTETTIATIAGVDIKIKIPANPNSNTATAANNILEGSNTGTQITYAPYSSTTATSTWVGTDDNAGKLYLGTLSPSKNTRLNYNGYLYATKLYSGGSEVKTTDANVTQTATDSTNANYEVLFSVTADNTTRTEGARKSSRLTYNPSTYTLKNGGCQLIYDSTNQCLKFVFV